MQTIATAVYKHGTLRLLTLLALPERARVRIQIMEEETIEDAKQRAEAALLASGLVKPSKPVSGCSKGLQDPPRPISEAIRGWGASLGGNHR